MPQVFRLFISSTFSDFSREREVLQQNVFPELDRYCQSRGYYFQPIDLRWGVSEEAKLDQKTLELCLNEVKSCKHFPHPNFLIMSGNRYGWIPLPYIIEASEFGLILQVIKEEADRLLLNEWYLLDRNQLPASYVIKERTSPYDDSSEWAEIEDKLRSILQGCVIKLDLSEVQREKYFLSATEQEVNEGIFHYSGYTHNQKKILGENPLLLASEKKYVFSFLREIENRDEFTDSIFVDKDQTDVASFKHSIKSTLEKENIIELTTRVTKKGRVDEKYLTHFKSRVADFLKCSIDEQMQELSLASELEAECDRQRLYLKNKLHLFSGRETDLKFISGYLANDDTRPLIIYGRSGLGKSSLMAKAIDDSFKGGHRRAVYRFIGVSPESGNTKSLWSSILKELGCDVALQGGEKHGRRGCKNFCVNGIGLLPWHPVFELNTKAV